MNLLLDSHTFLWWMLDNPRLSRPAFNAIKSADNVAFLSSATAWELATKFRLGKLPEAADFLRDPDATLAEAKLEPLPIVMVHAIAAGKYESAHRDPFDRILAAQSQIEDLTLVTNDPAFAEFPVKTHW